MEHVFRLVDFNVYNETDTNESQEDSSRFIIQMFGLDEKGKTYSLTTEGFNPFFYIMVSDKWNQAMKSEFLDHIQKKIGPYFKDSITRCKLIKRKKLYGFDGGKEHRFIFL